MTRQNANFIPQNARFELVKSADITKIVLYGDWTHRGIEPVCNHFVDHCVDSKLSQIVVDMSAVRQFDTAGAWLLRKMEHRLHQQSVGFSLTGASPDILSLLADIPAQLPQPLTLQTEQLSLFHNIFRTIGLGCASIWRDLEMGFYLMGTMLFGSRAQSKSQKGTGSVAAIFNQMDQIGVRAVPIIILMSLAIGAIVAQQAAFQLRVFGAEVFAADLVSVLQLRELGVLITSIMIAGRSGSAITAEIGSMKMREEIDALTVMGLNSVSVLIMPRMIAMIAMLPLLTIVSNFSALFSSAIVLNVYSDVPINIFFNRARDFADYTTVASGMIKTPFMAIIIGLVAAIEGLKVGGSAESLGRRVTAAVVKSIFLVIVMDGLFAIFFAAIDF